MSKKRAYAKAIELGATIEDDGGVYQLVAPKDQICGGSDIHTMAFSYEDGIKDPWSGRTVWQDILEQLQYGFEDCTHLDDCDHTV